MSKAVQQIHCLPCQIRLAGGLFLLGKSTFESYHKLEGEPAGSAAKGSATMGAVLIQIMWLDVVFSQVELLGPKMPERI